MACSNFASFNEIEGKTPPSHCEKGGSPKAARKTELIEYLRDSFDYGNRIAVTIDERNALAGVEGPYAAPNTRRGIEVVAVWRLADHYGEVVE